MKKQLEIDFLPVGEDGSGRSGDCILLRFGDLEKGGIFQYVVIIDGGYQKNAAEVKEHLNKYYKCTDSDGRLVIDCMILSHPDLDHVSGLVALAEDKEVIVREILMQRPWNNLRAASFKDNRITNNSISKRLKEAFDKAAELSEKTAKSVNLCENQGEEHELGDAKITILGPSKDFYMKCIANSNKTPEPANNFIQTFSNYIALTKQKSVEPYAKGQIKWNDDEGTSEINESSLIFLFEYEKQRFLFTGDAGKLGLSQAIEFAQSKQIDLKDLTLIKMPHHGSRKNVDPKLMDQLGNGETICVVSCVKGDDGHHPSKRLVNMLIEKGFKVFSTAGTILCKSYNNPPSRAGYGSVNPLPPYGNLEIL